METNKILARPERLMKKTKKELVEIIMNNDNEAKERENAIKAYEQKINDLKEDLKDTQRELEDAKIEIEKTGYQLYQAKRGLRNSLIIIGVITIALIFAVVF